MTHPAVVECAITGVPDEIRGQVVKATIVLSKTFKGKEGPELVKELQDHVKRVTAPYKYPRVIEFVEELPKTISGKIRRVEIRERINNQLWTDRSFIGKIIKNEKGFTSCVLSLTWLSASAQALVPITWTAYGLTFEAPKGILVEEDTEETFLLNNSRFYITIQSLDSDGMTKVT